jgi:opacity protein-like surface antigen
MLHAGDGVRSSLEVGCLFITPGADMKNVLFACAFGGVLASGAAMSAERTPNPALHKAAPNRLYSWEGLYLGANAGYGSGSDSRLDPGASGAQTGAFLDGPAQLAAQLAGLASLGLNTKGSLGGGQSGYNWQVGALVWGIETDFDGTHISGSVARNSNNPVTGFPPFSVQTNISGSQSLETFGTFRGRIGWTPFDRNLIYATVGWLTAMPRRALGSLKSKFSVIPSRHQAEWQRKRCPDGRSVVGGNGRLRSIGRSRLNISTMILELCTTRRIRFLELHSWVRLSH